MVVIPDEPTWAFVKGLTPPTVVIWLGATDEKTEGVWEWVDGTPIVFSAWLSGEPNNNGGPENYLATLVGVWNDSIAKGAVGYICEWKDK